MTKQRIAGRLLHDAVIVVPGIMGSELRDVENDRQLWGVRGLCAYTARLHSDRLRALAVKDEELAGRTGRIEATGLLNVAEWFPGLGTAQPYNRVLAELRTAAVHPSAVDSFPYDWRLSVEHNSGLLASAVRKHLDAWRSHGAHSHYLAEHPEAGLARILFVAHSMGGLLVRELLRDKEYQRETRAVTTVGTPFNGSVKAALMLNSGKGVPLPISSRLLSEVTPTMPGLYDLLPAYRALRVANDMREPTLDDLVALGGRRRLAQDALDRRVGRGSALPRHSMVVGFGQRTLQSYRMESRTAVGQEFMFVRGADDRVLLDADGLPRREDREGDGTVYQFAALLPGSPVEPINVKQDHTSLIRSRTVIDLVKGMLRGLRHPDELGAVLGVGELVLDVPEWIEPDTSLTITVTGCGDAVEPQCTVTEVSGRDEVLHPDLKASGVEGKRVATCYLTHPGLYEVEVGGGLEPVFRLVMVLPPEKDG